MLFLIIIVYLVNVYFYPNLTYVTFGSLLSKFFSIFLFHHCLLSMTFMHPDRGLKFPVIFLHDCLPLPLVL